MVGASAFGSIAEPRTQPAPFEAVARRKRVFSGIQPSGSMTIGNYLGAVRRWVRQQHERQSIHCIVNLHAMTLPYDPIDLRRRTLDLAAELIACGIDPEKAILFVQSEVPEHTELTWILSTQTMFGELGRMTQFKDKGRGDERVGSGLFFYPVLMAADIILYDTDSVPVGEDQRQHIELTRDVAQRFNSVFGETFVIPEADIEKEGARIMALDDPTKKMSKSGGPANYIAFMDSPDEIRRKINRAVTDSGSEIVARDDKPAMKNLLGIYSLFTDTPISELEARYVGVGYGQFKRDLAEAIIEQMAPIQARLAELQADPDEIVRILNRGTERAREIATPKMEQVRQVTGISLKAGW
ncbi:MAG: tryptophan--tRNA ligase [Chloroflexi bacterium]|nr:MAG: tryptophan--tRNA ligase [Chloroflexota bacterium]